MTKIIIERKKAIPGFLIPFRIFIDGEDKGSVTNGAFATFEVPAGTHKVRAKVNWARGSEDFEVKIAEGETRDLLIYPPNFAFLFNFISVLIAVFLINYLKTHTDFNMAAKISISVLPIFINGYVMKNKAIVIEQSQS